MAEDGWVSAGPRGRRLPPVGRPAPAEAERDDAAPRGVGLGTLSVSMVARGDVADRVRWRRFYEASAAVVGLVLALLAMFVLWLWYVPPAVPPPTLPDDVAVEISAVKLDESIRVRRPVQVAAATVRAAAPGPATINLPEGHEILSWRLDCATVGVASGAVARGARVITIPNVPPHGCRAVLTSPSANVPVENLVAGSHKTCAKSPTMRCR